MPHVLDSIVVFDPEGREARLGQLWADRTAVLVFVRHFSRHAGDHPSSGRILSALDAHRRVT